ncbi:MAG: DUF3857 domain-containing protein [Sphingobium sp.]|nr:DUF3857 domain-containing protein [Sphingobium sp.]
MRSLKTFVLATTMLSGAALAGADKPVIAPAPAWVKPLALPPLPDKPDEAPLRVLLADQQSLLEAGRVSNYVDIAMQLQTPQGLAAGNMSIPWNPDTDELTVHKLLIHRDGKAIDVLAGGQTFTVVRREPNLESATLDGVLTATIQPEGLQVGDVLEYAMTITTSDPVLKGHVEQIGGAWNILPFARTHLNVQWPGTLPVTVRQNGAMPPVKPVKAGGMSRVELSMDNVQPVLAPASAPARYSTGRVVEFSDFKSWADVGALLAPLYDVAAKVPAEGALRTELEKIKAASTDPVKRTEAALALVQDRVRYVALLMGAGGLTPAKAEETWARRYGDCKAKTALLLALLHELGIEAEPVAANGFSGDGIDQRLPMIGLFNHVLVRAHINGRAYWLDGTRTGDTSLARLRIPDFGWGLPLFAQNAALVRMLPELLAEPDDDFAVDFDLRSGVSLPAIVKATVTLRGDDALGMRLGLANMTADARDKALRDYFKRRLDDLEIAKVSASFDAGTGSEMLSMEGKARMDWSDGQYWTDATWVGYEADFSRAAGTDTQAPFAVGYPSFDRTVETIQLPPGFSEQNIFRKEPINETVAGLEYRRTSSLKDDVFRIERTIRAVAPEFAAKDAAAAQKRLKELGDLPVSLRKPDNYQMTSAEIDEELKTTPATAEGFIQRAGILMQKNRFAEARTALEGAVKLEPDNENAKFGMLGSYVGAQDMDGASKYLATIDLAKVKHPDLAGLAGIVFLAHGDFKNALAAYNRSLELKPEQQQILSARAQANYSLGNREAALADAAASLKIDPKQSDMRLLRAQVFKAQGMKKEGVAEADALIRDISDDSYAHVVAAKVLDAFGERERALVEIDKAITIKADVTAYLNRADLRPKSDLAGREADIQAAIKQEPELPDAHLAMANLQFDKGDFRGAVESYTKMMAKSPNNPELFTARGIAYTKIGDQTHADEDFAAGWKGAVGSGWLNNICYAKAKADVALNRALEECEAALKEQPDSAAILDSKAFVLLRLGRLDEAISVYDGALARAPEMAVSLFGRAIAWSRKGDRQRAQTDLAAALKLDPNVQVRFEGYGVKM